MGEGLPTPSATTWFRDSRTPERRMRASWHAEAGIVVLSLWTGELCTATFRLPVQHAPELIHLLVDAIAEEPSTASTPISRREKLRNRLRRAVRRAEIAPVISLRPPT